METGIVKAPNGFDKPEIVTPPIRYCLYARKSSEQDERQALSIQSQTDEMLAMAKKEGLEVAEIRQESCSAKASASRPVFMRLVADIREGLFQGVVTWAPDRLSRNAGDLGMLVDLMDQGKLHEIRTFGQTFRNIPSEKFLLMILGSQAKLENDQRGINVKRGMRAKVLSGWRPGKAPIGYINEYTGRKGEQRIFLDPERAPIVREAFRKIAKGGFSGWDLHAWLRESGLRTREGKPMALSAVYRMLREPYYCGKFEYPKGSGDWYKVGHESIIDEKLFDEVQTKLTVAPRSRPGTKEFDFVRLMKCGACGSGICAQEKFKKIKKDKSIRRYVYYHCTDGAKRTCRQPWIREEDLIAQLSSLMDKIDLDKVKTKERFDQEIRRFQRFRQVILSEKPDEQTMPDIDFRKFAKYILQEGSKEERRELLACLKGQIFLKNLKVYL